jgi:pantothenate kinase
MKHVILRLAGTFGSGKTTAMREFIVGYPCEVLMSRNKIAGYRLDLNEAGVRAPVFVVGKYDNVCGGTDAIKTQAEIAEKILKAHPLGHVLYEGALVSASGLAGQVTQAIHSTGCDVYAFLDTPQDLCIERVRGRRLAAGNEKEFDPKNLIQKFESVVNCYKNLRNEGSYDVRLINHEHIHSALLEIIREYENA